MHERAAFFKFYKIRLDIAQEIGALQVETERNPLAKFEECLQRLEKIVQELEKGDVPLETSLTLFEEGMTAFLRLPQGIGAGGRQGRDLAEEEREASGRTI